MQQTKNFIEKGERIIMEKSLNTNTLILNINGKEHQIYDVLNSETLSEVLRERLGLLGTKVACDEGACGACTVIIDEKPMLSCMILANTMEGKKIQTIEGLMEKGTPHPIQEAFLEERGFACGYCTSGFEMTTKAFLNENPNPTADEIKEALAGNICRCSVYEHIENSVKLAAKKMKGCE